MVKGIKRRLEALGIKPSKRLGQNFLSNIDIAKRQVQSANITSDDTVLEIGPGLGILTEEIVQRAGKVFLIEKEKVFADYLQEIFARNNLEVIIGDALEVEFPEFDKVVSNIPFKISSPLTFKLLDYDFKIGVLMYQKEFAQRLFSKPSGSDYSRLSVMASTKAEISELFQVSRRNFYPTPRVDASVVKIVPRPPDFDITNLEAFEDVVKELFNYRRKKIRNSLKYAYGIEDSEDIPFTDERVEMLTPKEINMIVDKLVENGLF